WVLAEPLLQAEQFQPGAHAFFSTRLPVNEGREMRVFLQGEVFVQGRFVRHVREPAAGGRVAGPEAAQVNVTVARQEVDERPEERAFAGAVRSGQEGQVTRFQAEVRFADYRGTAQPDSDVVGVKGRIGCRHRVTTYQKGPLPAC